MHVQYLNVIKLPIITNKNLKSHKIAHGFTKFSASLYLPE